MILWSRFTEAGINAVVIGALNVSIKDIVEHIDEEWASNSGNENYAFY